jgi:hypothetical protein
MARFFSLCVKEFFAIYPQATPSFPEHPEGEGVNLFCYPG